jgi:hypothetical protein
MQALWEWGIRTLGVLDVSSVTKKPDAQAQAAPPDPKAMAAQASAVNEMRKALGMTEIPVGKKAKKVRDPTAEKKPPTAWMTAIAETVTDMRANGWPAWTDADGHFWPASVRGQVKDKSGAEHEAWVFPDSGKEATQANGGMKRASYLKAQADPAHAAKAAKYRAELAEKRSSDGGSQGSAEKAAPVADAADAGKKKGGRPKQAHCYVAGLLADSGVGVSKEWLEKCARAYQRAKELGQAIEGVLDDNDCDQIEEDVVMDALSTDHGCGAIKVEGGRRLAETISFLTERGVPVMGHVGLTPQAINTIGSFRAQGREEKDWGPIEDDARSVADAGAFSLVIEAHAIDQGDKAPGKALSYAKKYAVLKLLEIESGEGEEERQRGPDPQSGQGRGPSRQGRKRAGNHA